MRVYRYPFPNESLLFVNQETCTYDQEFYFFSSELLNLINQTFKSHYDKSLTIINPMASVPTYFEISNHIFLNVSSGVLYSQITYQLSHEMCHYFIDTGIQSENLRWFEESICECSSQFFLLAIASQWKLSNDTRKQNYSSSFIEYQHDLKQNIEPFELKKDTTYDKYNRKKNAYIASILLPIFLDNSTLWSDVSLLNSFETDNIFELLTLWKQEANSCNKQSIDLIISAFN